MLNIGLQFLIEKLKILSPTNTAHQTNLFGEDLLQQLDLLDLFFQLAVVIPWPELKEEFAKYTHQAANTAMLLRITY